VIANNYSHIDHSHNEFKAIIAGDFDSLDKFLAKQKVSQGDHEKLKGVLEEAESGQDSEESQEKLESWVGDVATEMVEGIGGVAKDSAKKALTETLTEALKTYGPTLAQWGVTFG